VTSNRTASPKLQAQCAAVEQADGARFEGRLCGGKVRLRYLAQRLHALGPRPLFHFIDEIEQGHDLRRYLERYASLPADFIKFASILHGIDGGSA
jgi:hypothetical protein